MRKSILFLLTFVFAAAFMLCPMAKETDTLESGVYTVRNRASGKLLNAFDFVYSKGGSAYVDKEMGEDGENILIVKRIDGTYLLSPQSDAGKYAFCVEKDKKGQQISRKADVSGGSYFSIAKENDGYVIRTGEGYALGTTEEKLLYRLQLVLTEEYSGADTQIWDIVPVETTSIELKSVTDKIKLNSVGSVYALTKPAYMKNFAKWYSSDESLLMIDDDGSFCALGTGKVTVTAEVDGLSASIDLEIVDEGAFTWYSQHLSAKGGWHGSELSGVYFYWGAYKRFIIDGFNRGLDWMDEGCAITSASMVLHNMGAKYKDGYDFRFEANGDLEADPYTVALANSGNKGLTTSKGTLYYSPIYMNPTKITSNFTLYGQKLVAVQKSFSKQALKDILEEHPEGVIVAMKNSYNGSHYIVATECINPDAARANDYRFTVYDSAGFHRGEGDNVAFEKSISYLTMRYRYSHMYAIIYFDFVPEEE